ncbi:hypothetical protein ACP70R_037557 [Stipagrostis hirtigluma subsp. patula]
MDFHALSRRELQALCKRNRVRANMSNAAMAEALQSLPSVDGIGEIERTAPALASPTEPAAEVIGEGQRGRPPRSGRARAATREAAADTTEEAVPPPATSRRSRRTAAQEAAADKTEEAVPVPATSRRSRKTTAREAVADKAEEAVLAPATSQRSRRTTSREAAADKTEEAVPAPATSRRSRRTAAREAAAPVEAEGVPTPKRRTRRSVRSRVKIATVARKKSKADSSDATIGSEIVVSDKSCDDAREEQVVAAVEEVVSKPEEGTVEYQEPISTAPKSAALVIMQNSPILSVLPKPVATEPVIKIAQDSELEMKKTLSWKIAQDGERSPEWSPSSDITDEFSSATKATAAAIDEETVKEDDFAPNVAAYQSNLLVNTLDKFAKPMYKFTVKEKKEGECWWMLM